MKIPKLGRKRLQVERKLRRRNQAASGEKGRPGSCFDAWIQAYRQKLESLSKIES